MARIKTCAICNTPGNHILQCPDCGNGAWCSDQCREMDQPLHDVLCKEYKKLPKNPPKYRDDQYYVVAIYFDPSKDHPELYWVYASSRGSVIKGTPVDGYNSAAKPKKLLLSQAADDSHKFEKVLKIEHNLRRGFILNHSNLLQLHLRGYSRRVNTPHNQSLAKLVTLPGQINSNGPVVMTRRVFDTTTRVVGELENFNLNDLRSALDYLSGLRLTIRVVWVSCHADKYDAKLPGYEAKVLDFDHKVFENALSPLSQLVDVPIHVKTLQHADELVNSESNMQNVAAAFLMIDWDKMSRRFGEFLPSWAVNDKFGAVYAARLDKTDLKPQHVEALSLFGRRVLMPIHNHLQEKARPELQLDGVGDGEDAGRKVGVCDKVLKYATMQYFDTYFELLRAARQVDYHDWKHVCNPYRAHDMEERSAAEKKEVRKACERSLRMVFDEMSVEFDETTKKNTSYVMIEIML